MLTALVLSLVASQDVFVGWPNSKLVPANPQEGHLRNVRQLTFGGQNAEAYWNMDGTKIVWKSSQPGFPDE